MPPPLDFSHSKSHQLLCALPPTHTHAKHPGTSGGYSAVYPKGWVPIPGKQQVYSLPASVYHREKRHIALGRTQGLPGNMEGGHHCNPSLQRCPLIFTLQDLSGATVAWHGMAQGGLSAFGSFPTGRGNPRPSPAGSLVIAGKTGEERASRTVPVSRAQVPG